MPFKSEKQRKWMHANEPEMAKKWEKKEKKMKRVKELIKKMVREELAEMKESKLTEKQSAAVQRMAKQGMWVVTDGGRETIKVVKNERAAKMLVKKLKKSGKYNSPEAKAIELEGKLTEVDFNKIKLPSQVNRFLDKFVQSMKGANLNRMKRASILYKVIDAAGMTPQQLMADIQKIKTAMKND